MDTLLQTDRPKIRELHGKTKEDIDKDIDIILEWFKSQKHLPEPLSRHVIERILIISKFSIERTKQICDMYFTARNLIPEVFHFCNPQLPEIKVYFEKVLHYFPLPRLTKELYRVNLIRYQDFDFPDYNSTQFLTLFQIMFEILAEEELSMGDILILDFKHIKKQHVVKATPMHLKTVYFFLENIWATRVKAVHFVNVPIMADIIISFAKSIMKKKILSRTHVHDSYEKLFEYVPREILPKDYGGEERSLDELNELWKLKYQQYQPRYDHLLKLEVNEALRPEPLVNSDILGYYGNFKKIDVD